MESHSSYHEAMENAMEENFEDWKGGKAIHGMHGGIGPASIACVVQMMENLVFIANGFNFVQYFMVEMHYSAATAANMVTNFMGTTFLVTLFGGFIADCFLTHFTTFIIFCCMELMGLILLTFQSHNPKLLPEKDETPSTLQSMILFIGLYAMATGAGGIKATLPTHGADQLDRNPRLISRFFSWLYFSMCFGCFLAVTVLLWIEETKGWNWSFNISVGILAISLCTFAAGLPFYRFKRPNGSPLTKIFLVIISAARNRYKSDLDEEMMQSLIPTDNNIRNNNKLKCLDKAMLNKNISRTEVEETKTFLGLLPIFGSTIVMSCCLAQLSTFSVQQGMIMNRQLFSSLEIPVQSLTAIGLVFMLISIPLYEFFGKKISSGNNINRSSSFNLKRIGLGLALSSVAMAVAAIVEAKRKHEAVHNNLRISVFWLVFQYVILSVSDMFTLVGMLEFFYREAPSNMKSISTALGWCSNALGFFLSTTLVDITNAVTGKLGHQWLGGEDLNKTRLELFYVVLCILNTLNLVNYFFWAKRY